MSEKENLKFPEREEEIPGEEVLAESEDTALEGAVAPQGVEVPEGCVGVIVHKEIFTIVQALEHMLQEEKWDKIDVGSGIKPGRAEAFIHVRFSKKGPSIIVAPANALLGNKPIITG